MGLKELMLRKIKSLKKSVLVEFVRKIEENEDTNGLINTGITRGIEMSVQGLILGKMNSLKKKNLTGEFVTKIE